jgi:hypothetical protein
VQSVARLAKASEHGDGLKGSQLTKIHSEAAS